jgi:predicted RNase H-like HicB family nuclease
LIMNLDIIVKPAENGRFAVVCPDFPDCESEGATLEEALDAMIDKVADAVALNIKADLRENFKDLRAKISPDGRINVPLMMTKLPLSLN